MSGTVHCPALLISAPASGQGKTTITAALARFYRQQGKKVRVFKTGPDFLDPMILEQAAGQPVYQLDLWMGGEQHCRQLLYKAAVDADLILIEGVMGLFDGTSSSADLAELFGIPVLAIIDSTAMAQTFGALAYGLAHYRPALPFAGVMANRVASAGHADMLKESLPEDVACLGMLTRDSCFELPSRHLGLLQAKEIVDLDRRIEQAAQALVDNGFNYQPAPIRFEQPDLAAPAADLGGIRIAVARDSAFGFVYRANLELLQDMGAELCFFSPLKDRSLPQADSLYLPGGYPELHLQQLAQNRPMHEAIRSHHEAGKPTLAECGGMLYLFDSLTDKEGRCADMIGLLPGHARMQPRLANLGLQSVELAKGVLHGHTFHHSQLETDLEPLTLSKSSRKHGRAEAVYRQQGLHASYLHLYFPSNPQASASLFRA
ncbi:MAG TPA: cobyrinate a,c-diamide synthase [Gammaproteobacteria bacterium]|nr:cobyrinate a,c-diamide synthase [Gammaproteobacteria bacterium]